MNQVMNLVNRNMTVALSPVFLLWQAIYPLLYIFIAGFSYSTIVPGVTSDGVDFDYHVYLATGMIGYNVMNSALVSGLMIWNDRKHGMFSQILMGPFTRRQYVLANTITIGIIGTASAALIVLVGFPIFHDSVVFSPLTIPLIAFSVIVGSVLFGSLASIVSILVRSTEGFNVMLETVFLLFAYISTAYYPAEGIPEPYRIAFQINPLTHLVDTIRAGLFGALTETVILEMAALAAVAGALFVAAAWLLARVDS